MTNAHAPARKIWTEFCNRFEIVKECVPLFEARDSGQVKSRSVGREGNKRLVLARSREMDALIKAEVRKLVGDWESNRLRYDGLLYMMGRKLNGSFVPLYIGKAETLGKGDGNLSANLQRLDTDCSKFARWGDNYSYHIGDLSACVFPGHSQTKKSRKYESWAKSLFVEVPTVEPVLTEPVYFWARAWDKSWIGVWPDLGPTRLAFLEYLLIGVASLVSPELLNREGLARGQND